MSEGPRLKAVCSDPLLNNENCSNSIQLSSLSSPPPPGLSKKISNGKNNGKRKMMTNLVKRPPVTIEYENLSYFVSENNFFWKKGTGNKTILKGISGKFKSGELTAIMGPSGAGKSTLLNIMTGYKTSNVSGNILINGKPRNLGRFRKMSCYIMQDDCLSQHLSVGEAMNVAANLKLGEKTSKEEKDLVIGEILDNLGLTECIKTRTNKISGGQRKRLAIALELVNNPPVMFFDEPTSGLDSSSCMQCIGLLKQLAREGRTIICTIHQPSARIFEMFDKLIMLADGQNIYRGTVRGLVPFLDSMGLHCPSYHNPADFAMEIASGDYGQYIEKLVTAVQNGKCNNLCEGSPKSSVEHFKKNSSPEIRINAEVDEAAAAAATEHSSDSLSSVKITVIQRASSYSGGLALPSGPVIESLLGDSSESVDRHYNSYPTSFLTQFRILFYRTFISIIRDETLTKIRIISQIVIGFILGSLYWDMGNEAGKVYNNSAMLFFCMLYNLFAGMMPTVMTFPLEMGTFKREHLNYWYSVKAYYLAKSIADFPFQIICPSIFVVIVYFMTSQPADPSRFGMFILMCILTSLVAQSLGLLIGVAFDAQSAVFLGPISTIPILLFSGFFVSLKNIPTYMQWLTYVAYVRYAFEGSMLAIYGFNREKLHCSQAYCHFKYPQKLLEEFAIEKAIYWIDVVALISIFLILRLSGYFVLKYKIRSEK